MTTAAEKRILAAARRFAALAEAYRFGNGSPKRTDAAEIVLLNAVYADAAARKRRKPAKYKPETPSPYDLSEPVRRKK